MKLFFTLNSSVQLNGKSQNRAGMQIWDREATPPDAFGVVLVTKTSV